MFEGTVKVVPYGKDRRVRVIFPKFYASFVLYDTRVSSRDSFILLTGKRGKDKCTVVISYTKIMYSVNGLELWHFPLCRLGHFRRLLSSVMVGVHKFGINDEEVQGE